MAAAVPKVWIQHISVSYTKASRGAPASTLRNAAPRAFSLGWEGTSPFCYELYEVDEAVGFAPRLAARDCGVLGVRVLPDIAVRVDDHELVVDFRWNPTTGLPRRRSVSRALSLRQGQWARLMTNGRYTSYSGQRYHELTYNIAFGVGLAGGIFVDGEAPVRVFDVRAELF